MSNAGVVIFTSNRLCAVKDRSRSRSLGELSQGGPATGAGVTDTTKWSGAIEVSDKMAGYGIKPIIGCELAVDFGDKETETRAMRSPRRRRGSCCLWRANAVPQP